MRAMKARVVAGFRFAGVAAGVKKKGGLDLGLIVADRIANVAAVFTRNRVQAAPVLVAKERVRIGKAHAVLVNSGCANACTGKKGIRATVETTRLVAHALGVAEELVLPASTGVIGAVLPVEPFARNAHKLCASLEARGVDAFSRAIMTTDRGPKVAHKRLTFGGRTVNVLGVAKGAGMIHPNMATTLAFVLTDASVPTRLLQAALSVATDNTFNAATVDGDTSTNDTIIAMASGAVNGPVKPGSREYRMLLGAFTDVLGELAEQIVADGEGARHLVRIEVSGARTVMEARSAAATIACSPLVKTAIHGVDANWGRIVAAAGRSDAIFDQGKVKVSVGNVPIVKNGLGIGVKNEARAALVMKRARYTIAIDLGAGRAKAHYLTCDFGPEYVRINAGYRS